MHRTNSGQPATPDNTDCPDPPVSECGQSHRDLIKAAEVVGAAIERCGGRTTEPTPEYLVGDYVWACGAIGDGRVEAHLYQEAVGDRVWATVTLSDIAPEDVQAVLEAFAVVAR